MSTSTQAHTSDYIVPAIVNTLHPPGSQKKNLQFTDMTLGNVKLRYTGTVTLPMSLETPLASVGTPLMTNWLCSTYVQPQKFHFDIMWDF